MKVKNNYNECLTNLACSIRKYFELEYHHNTLNYIDKILYEKKPNNVIIMLFDGMGSRILKRVLENESLFKSNLFKEITTVFPATTTAATTSIRTGLNPIEHGWIGWDTYIKPIDKTITLFLNSEKGKKEICKEFLDVKDKLVTKTIVDEIEEKGLYHAKEFFPFETGNAIVYSNIDDMLNLLLKETKKEGKKFLYAYDSEPDHTMHEFGPDSELVKKIIEERDIKISELSKKLTDSLLIIVADHGHIKVDNIFLNDYPEFLKMLERTTSIEQRAVSFKVKNEYLDIFVNKFNELFGEYFKIYNKNEILESNIFGDGVPNELFEDAIGDFIAIAENSNKCLVSDGCDVLFSQHAGYTDDEVFVPLIVIDKTENKLILR